MNRSFTTKRTWFWLLSVLLLFIVVSFLFTSPQPEKYPDFASDSPAPTGVKAIYTYLEDTSRWTHSPQLLANKENDQLLVMVEPYFIPESDQMQAYTAFMEAGNSILLVQTNPDGMFTIDATYIPEQLTEYSTIFGENGTEYRAEVASPVRLKTKESDEILLYDQFGAIAYKRGYGDGNLIVANAPQWLTNDQLLNKDHLPLVLSLFETGSDGDPTILFDEYSHGVKNASSLTTLYPQWLLVIGVQSIILTILWLVYRGKRFGPIFVAREEMVRFSDERINALAAWYQRRKRYRDSLAIQADYLKMLVHERWGIPSYMPWEDIASQLEKKQITWTTDEVRTLLNGVDNALNKQKITKQEYLQWANQMDQLQKEVEKNEK